MRSAAPRSRPLSAAAAFTLAEIVVALAVAGVVFGAFALVVARQERAHGDLARRIRARAQIDEGAAALATDLRGISAAAGDIPPGGALDSAIEFRATVGTAVACGLQGRALLTALASFVTMPTAGDTAWAYDGDSLPATWAPLAIADVSASTALTPACAPLGTSEALRSATRRRATARYSLELSEAAAIPTGLYSGLAPVRVTRPVRYSLYRAPDGGWYLGRREWSAAQARFASVQPVSGPYRPYAPPGTDSSGLELRYFAADGAAFPSGASETRRIARVTVTLRALAPPGSPLTRERDVPTFAIALRNQR